jgi:outer membrane protein
MRLLNLAVYAVFSATFLAAPSLASANELLRVYDLAAQNDTQLRAASAARDAGLQALPAARGALLPQLNATGEYGYQDQEQVISGSPPRISHGTSTSYGANLTQTLFNREQWLRLRQADDRAALAQAQYRSAVQNLALRSTEAYFNVLAAADNLRFANAENQAIERQLELAKKRFEVGLSAITDVQEAQARYDLTVALTIEAEQALASAREALSEITGPAQLTIQPLKEEFPLQGPDPDSVTDWLKAASESNLDLLAAEINSQIAGKDVNISGSRHWPTVTAQGSYQNSESPSFFGETESSQVGVGVNVPIFSGGITQANVSAARSTHEQRLAELEGTRRQVERRTRDAYQGVIAGVSRVKARKQAVLSNTTALEAAEVGLEVGARTAVDVLNAQRELYSAQRDYARARYDYLLNILRLKSAAGQLSQKDLIEIDSLLASDSGSEVAG